MSQGIPIDPGGQNVAGQKTGMKLRSHSQQTLKRGLDAAPNHNNHGLLPPRPKSPYREHRQSTETGAQIPGSSSGTKSPTPGSSSGSKLTLSGVPGITVSNEYDLLQEVEFDDENNYDEMPLLTPAEETMSKTPPPSRAKKVRVPPISVLNQTTRQLRELMNRTDIAQTDYHMKATKSGVQLICTGEECFRSTLAALKTTSIQYHTYTLACEQPVKIMLTGLPVYDVNDLEAELFARGINATEVKLFSRKVVGLEEMALYLLHFTRGAVKLSELQKVKHIFNVGVKWRYFERKPTDAVQCHRCQRYGHGMRNCNLSPLCVKCGQKHLSAECQLPKKADLVHIDVNTTRESIKCANCNGQHTANYRGCPSRKNYVEKLAKLRAERRQPAPPPPPPRPHQGRVNSSSSTHPSGNSYAEVLSGHASSTSDMFTMTEFLTLARDMFDRLASCKTKQDQILALFELTTKYTA